MKLLMVRCLWRLAALMRRLGIPPPVRLGRRIVRAFMREISFELDGLRFRAPSANAGLVYRFAYQADEAVTMKLFKESVKSGMKVLDVGANIGIFTVLAAKRVGPDGQVLAFEPDPRTRAYLEWNLRRNDVANLVSIEYKALFDDTREVSFVKDRAAFRSSIFGAKEEGETILVEAARLDDMIADNETFDVLKMDIEGAEVRALRGMSQMIARSRDKLCMFIECNPTALEQAGASAAELLAQLHGLGFRVFIVNEQNDRLDETNRSTEIGERVNLLCAASSCHFQ